TPASGSEAERVTVTGPLFQPEAFGAGDGVALVTGGVRSILMPATVTLPVLPATSIALPVALRLAPSPVTTTGSVSDATPESASAALNVTVTSPLFQPFPFGAGAA